MHTEDDHPDTVSDEPTTADMIPGRRRRGVRFAARFILVSVIFAVLGILTAGSEAGDTDMSGVGYVAGIIVLGWAFVGAYELLAWGATAVLGRIAGPARPKVKRRPRRPTVFTPARALVVLATYIGGSAVVAGLLLGFVEGLGGSVTADTLASGPYSWIIITSLIVAATAAWGMFLALASRRDRVRMRRWLRSPGARIVRMTVSGAVLFALFVAFVLPFILPVSQSYEPGTVSRMASASGWPRVWLVIIAVGIAPPVEETLFRGVVLEALVRRIRRFDAILVTTLLFGLAHTPDILGNWPAVAAILGGGWALAELRLRTRSLVPGVAAHMVYNGVLMMLAFL